MKKKWKVSGLKEVYVECVVEAEDEEAAMNEAYFNGKWIIVEEAEGVSVDQAIECPNGLC